MIANSQRFLLINLVICLFIGLFLLYRYEVKNIQAEESYKKFLVLKEEFLTGNVKNNKVEKVRELNNFFDCMCFFLQNIDDSNIDFEDDITISFFEFLFKNRLFLYFWYLYRYTNKIDDDCTIFDLENDRLEICFRKLIYMIKTNIDTLCLKDSLIGLKNLSTDINIVDLDEHNIHLNKNDSLYARIDQK